MNQSSMRVGAASCRLQGFSFATAYTLGGGGGGYGFRTSESSFRVWAGLAFGVSPTASASGLSDVGCRVLGWVQTWFRVQGFSFRV